MLARLKETLAFLREHRDAFASLASIGTFVVLAFAVYQYRRAEKWKGSEFIAKLYERFSTDPKCRRAMQILESAGPRAINFGTDDKPRPATITLRAAVEAMKRSYPEAGPTSLEIDIRETFDEFFSYMVEFEVAIRNRLVSKRRVYPYLSYWIEILRGQRSMTVEQQDAFDAYMEALGYEYAKDFLDRRWPRSSHYEPAPLHQWTAKCVRQWTDRHVRHLLP